MSDLHVVLDHVQFEKNSFINRNRLRTPQGWCWVTVPILTKGKFGDLEINTLEIAEKHNWQKDHWKTIKFNYSNAKHMDEHKDYFAKIYGQEWNELISITKETTGYLLDKLGIDTPIVHSSDMDVEGSKDELILNICKNTKADLYLSGEMGSEYLDELKFEKENIRVVYQNYNHPTYEQVFDGFESDMSALDLLLNEGPDSLSIIMSGNRARDNLRRS